MAILLNVVMVVVMVVRVLVMMKSAVDDIIALGL